MVTARRKSSDRPAPRVSALLGLQKVELFKGLDSASLREIAQQCTWTRYKANVTVIRREEADRAVHFVISGLVRLAAPSARGRTLTLRDVPAPRVSALLGLQKVELFKGLDSASLREIAQQCTWTRYKANVTVIRRE